MTIYALDGLAPRLPEGGLCYIAPGARLIGDVVIAEHVSIWFNAVLRGDNEPIEIGAGSNIQDNCVLHTDPGFPLVIGQGVTVGHSAVVHGCTVGDGCLIGMGAVVMNGARIGAGSIIGARALVTERMEIPPRSLVLGAPGKVVREVGPEGEAELARAAQVYRDRGIRYARELRAL